MVRLSRHKYGAVATEIDGHVFPSKREARRYQELVLLAKAGEIDDLELQPSFDLEVAAYIKGVSSPTKTPGIRHPRKICKYVADFRYTTKDGQTVIEDAKGFKTPVYRLKKRIVEAQYGITISEV